MRTLALLLFAGCSWSSFDQLADSTWAHSVQKPNIGSSDYGIAIANATVVNSVDGGRLAVIGNSGPTYSTIAFHPTGASDVGPNPQKLGEHFISSLPQQPILVANGGGKIALVAAAIDAGNIAVVSGDADAVGDMPFVASAAPDAATFIGDTLVIAAGTTLYLQTTGAPKTCTPTDAAAKPVAIAALADGAADLWAWTKDGALFAYQHAALMTCTTTIAPDRVGTFSTSFMPGVGSQVQYTTSGPKEFVILAGHVDKGTMGSVIVVDGSSLKQVGTTYAADGIASSTVLTNGSTVLALGFPDRIVDGKTTGQVEVHAFDPMTGVLDADFWSLNDAQPDNAELYGRSLATLTYDGKQILVVGASNEIFAYYRTAFYSDTRTAQTQ